ncbi:MAG: aminotransferase class I/II-fold pyridoxal phosphate-dependent enzyme [Actinomycetota bacterium]
MNTPPLSLRGHQLLADSPIPEYIREHLVRSGDAAPDDPDRYVCLSIAQNLLMWDVLDEHLNDIREVQPASIAYDDQLGSLVLRQQIAEFGSSHIWNRTVSADNVAVLAGAGAVLELLFYVLADAGDGILVPTPSYAFYWTDIETRKDLTVIPVHTSSQDGFRLTPDLLEEAATSAEVPIKALLLTNPDNPTGRLMPSEDLAACIEWARSRGIHTVVNGVYSLTTRETRRLTPVSSVVDDMGSDIHEIWAFSKDFAMSGLRAGVLVTQNKDALAAIAEIAHWSVVSGDTQHLLTRMLSDRDWVGRYLAEMRKRLTTSYVVTTAALDAAGIPYLNGDAGLFVLADIRPFMTAATWEEEHRIWRRILDKANVNVTPGSACHIVEPGFVRICFATEPPDVVASAISRIADVLG